MRTGRSHFLLNHFFHKTAKLVFRKLFPALDCVLAGRLQEGCPFFVKCQGMLFIQIGQDIPDEAGGFRLTQYHGDCPYCDVLFPEGINDKADGFKLLLIVLDQGNFPAGHRDDNRYQKFLPEILNGIFLHQAVKKQLVYSPLNGTGNVPVREIMKRLGNITVDIVSEQEKPDGHFPTCPYPNPEIREAMQLAIRKMMETGADLCFATDPDCDRMGAAVRNGNDARLITGNEMGILMLDYLCRNTTAGSLPRVVVKTIVSTEMAEPVCRRYGIELRNVLTGFKFIGEQIGLLEKAGQKDRFLFGFEESYGYLSGTDVRDKDAVNAALLLCEMASQLKAEGKSLADRLEELQKEYGCYAQRLLTFQYDGEDGLNRMNRIMEKLRHPLEQIGQSELEGSERTDYLCGVNGLPSSDVVEFRLSGGRKIVVRPSGTEPKLKAYLFASGENQAAAEEVLDGLESIVGSLCGK